MDRDEPRLEEMDRASRERRFAKTRATAGVCAWLSWLSNNRPLGPVGEEPACADQSLMMDATAWRSPPQSSVRMREVISTASRVSEHLGREVFWHKFLSATEP